MEDIKNKKILMALMSFSIGGAETHVLELSAELKKKGFDVVLVSGGGEYEEVSSALGIKHYEAPLYTKNPLAMLSSLKILRNIIKKEKIDIVHAHGRIPAFLCGILRKSMDFIFVTTAHWVFNTGYGLKYLSNWGEKTVAVSEDIKTYLMDNYGTNAMDIFVTINGIDTDKFSPDASFSSAIEEFSLSPDSRKVVYISRLDSDRAEVAFRLLNIAEKIYADFPDIEIVIVGGGDVFDRIKQQTDALNERVGKRLVTLTGARTDIFKFAAMADVFIGVSRSALEAMSCAKPVIVAGNEGYIGIFDSDKLPVSIETNFCCRGCEPSSDERLFEDLSSLLSADEQEIKRLSEFSREIIKSRYSLSKMAEDNIRMYVQAADSYKYDAVISGYYGFGNSGDEALLSGIIENLKKEKEDIKICVLSKSPSETAKEHGVHSVNRYDYLKIKKAIKSSRLFISGGGSLIQDVTSSKSLWYYTSLIKLAKKCSVPIMIYANGIGPVLKESNRKRTKEVLEFAEKITLREDGSYDELLSLGVNMEKVCVTADPAFSLEPASEESAEEIFRSEGIGDDKKCVGICLREWKGAATDFKEVCAAALKEICTDNGLFPVFIPLKSPDDLTISKEIGEKMGIPFKVIERNLSPREHLAIVKKMDIMLCMRLHALIYAAKMAVPTVNISYDPKVLNIAKYLGIERNIDVSLVTKEALKGEFLQLLENYENVKSELLNNSAKLQEMTGKDARLASEIINRR